MFFSSVDSLSAENMIPDSLKSPVSIYKVSFRSVIAIYHCVKLVQFSPENVILSSQTSLWSI